MYGTYACDYVVKKNMRKHKFYKDIFPSFLFGFVHETTFPKGWFMKHNVVIHKLVPMNYHHYNLNL
jgi:hypothetical protein